MQRSGLVLVILAYLVIGVQYAVWTPAWQVPDEPAHYNVIRQIAQTGTLPRLEPGDYDQAYLARLTGEQFPPHLPLEQVQYQDYQPPLYYLLAAPVFLLFNGALLPLRLFSLLLGAGVLLAVYAALRRLAPSGAALALTAAAFIAFIPQHTALMAGVNNDALSELMIALGVYWMVREINEPPPTAYALGLVLGLAFITKVWAYILVPAIGVMLALRWRREGGRNWQPIARRAAEIFIPALLIGSFYWGRNVLVCGQLDFLCGQWHNQVVVGQPATAWWIEQFGWAAYLERYARFTFDSFWGVFGWMGVFLPEWLYQALLVFSVALLIGLAGAAPGWRRLTPAQREAAWVLAALALTTLALYAFYNLTFVQHQGRYLFPALSALGAAAAVSLWTWGAWLAQAARRRVAWLVPLGAIIGLAALCLFALYRVIIPALA